jgi:hypothetical protein
VSWTRRGWTAFAAKLLADARNGRNPSRNPCPLVAMAPAGPLVNARRLDKHLGVERRTGRRDQLRRHSRCDPQPIISTGMATPSLARAARHQTFTVEAW